MVRDSSGARFDGDDVVVGGRLTTASSFGSGRPVGGASFTVFRVTGNGTFSISASEIPDSATTVTSLKDFGSGAQAVKVQIRGSIP